MSRILLGMSIEAMCIAVLIELGVVEITALQQFIAAVTFLVLFVFAALAEKWKEV